MRGDYLLVVTLAATFYVVLADDKPIVPVPSQCPIHDSLDYTVHLAHENDCTKYYTCQEGERILKTCPLRDTKGNKLHFNKVLQVCDWPRNAGCTPREEEPPLPISPTSSSAAPLPPVKPPTSGCANNPDGTRIADKTDCSVFYECESGLRIRYECDEGLLYNPDLKVCDNPGDWSHECKAGKKDVEPRKPICPIGATQIIFLPHECSCEKFYICRKGKQILRKCEGDLHWNNEAKFCDTPEEANCEYNKEA